MLFGILFFLDVQNMLFRVNRQTLVEDAQEFFQIITTFLRPTTGLRITCSARLLSIGTSG